MEKKKKPYEEGTWFVVPLIKNKNKKYVLGLIARLKSGYLLCYFYGPKRIDIPTLQEIEHLKAEDAQFITITYDFELKKKGSWNIIGRCENWNRNDFPMPIFGIIDGSNNASKIIYDPDDPGEILDQVTSSIEEVKKLPQEGTYHPSPPDGSLLWALEDAISEN